MNKMLTCAGLAPEQRKGPKRMLPKRLFRALPVIAAALALTGCVEQLGDLRGQFAPVAATPVRLPVGSVRGASVALASVEGAPDAVTASFRQNFGKAAATHDIALTDMAKANYLVRGYLTAYPVEGGTEIGYVWDIFDAAKHRTQRVTDAIFIKARNDDAWALADEPLLDSLASKSADDLASFLAGTPEVIAASKIPNGKPAAPLAFAPAD